MNRFLTRSWCPFSFRCLSVCCSGLLVSGLVAGVPADGQITRALSSGVTVSSQKSVAPLVTASDVLSGDSRLNTQVTLSRRSVTMESALAEFTKQTKVRLAAGGNETPYTTVALAVKGEPLRDVLRALAALNGLQWKRTKTAEGQDVLLLNTPDDPRMWDYLRPRTQAEANVHRAIQDFADAMTHLSPDMRDAIAVPHEGVAYSSLPPQMQQCVQNALQAQLETLSSRNFSTPISLDNLSTMQVSFQAKPGDGLTSYTMDVSRHDLGNVMMACSRPNDPAAQDDSVQEPGHVPFQMRQRQALTAWYDSARAKAVTDDPRLRQLVSIKTEDASLGYPLVALAAAAHINIVAQSVDETHTVSFASIPIKDALDQIATKYHSAWGVAADGMVLLHGLPPSGAARQKAMEAALKRATQTKADSAGE